MKMKRIVVNAMVVAAMAVPTLVMAANRMPPTPFPPPLPKPCVSSPNATHRCPPPPKGVPIGVGR